ncbi:hypothetical protein [uncultured Alsobacter sp.]|uniref:hypothetical protein n=1 Tax=uncultured Alsobacter sp. TaxID=1748258 RepID=UPI0025E0B759|nr:hypothetical protein [uncultured Alsobacter sp.]
MRGYAIAALGSLLVTPQADAATMAWICQFPTFDEPITFVWEVGKPMATMIGNAGTAPVRIHGSDRIISFVEFVDSGAVMSTTIVLANGSAVHSRNTVLRGNFVVSQAKGTCQQRD